MIRQRVEMQKRGLHDVFTALIAHAMKTTPEDAKTILDL